MERKPLAMHSNGSDDRQRARIESGPTRDRLFRQRKIVRMTEVQDGGKSWCVWPKRSLVRQREAHPENDLIRLDADWLSFHNDRCVLFVEGLLTHDERHAACSSHPSFTCPGSLPAQSLRAFPARCDAPQIHRISARGEDRKSVV